MIREPRACASVGHLVTHNVELLLRGRALLQGIDDRTYRCPVDTVFGSTIGGHVRHNLDHYTLFLDGLSACEIDYEPRAREARIEASVEAACTAIGQVCERLHALHDGQMTRPLFLRTRGRIDPVATSVPRELDFLSSHTVHHYALVAVLCRLQDIDVDREFGVAPSTLRHRLQCRDARHG